jgi:hypothetical protein
MAGSKSTSDAIRNHCHRSTRKPSIRLERQAIRFGLCSERLTINGCGTRRREVRGSAYIMAKTPFRTVAGSDGSVQLPSVNLYLLAHGIGTILLIIILLAAGWGFMDWVVTPSACPADSAPASSATATPPDTSRPGGPGHSPDGRDVSHPRPAEPMELPASASSSAREDLALATSGCPCPSATVKTPRDPAAPLPALGAGRGGKRSPS